MSNKNKSQKTKNSNKVETKTEKVEQKHFNIPNWGIYLFFALTTVIFFSSQLSGNSFFWDDFIEQVYPIQQFAAQSFSDFEIPFWNPYTFCGMPFYADLQVGFFYPMNRLTALFIDSSGSLSVWGLQFIIILHFFIAQLSFYLFARYLKASKIASVLGSISFAFSFSLVLHVFHPMMVYHLSWFPLVLLYYFRAIDEIKIKYSLISGLIFGLSMLAGHPQSILYQALFLGLYFAWQLVRSIRLKEVQNNKVIKYVIAGIIPLLISVLIFSVQYLPSQQLADLSKRGESTYELASEGSLKFSQIFTSIVPDLFGYVKPDEKAEVPYHLEDSPYYYYWDTAFYFGIASLILALFIISIRQQNKYKGFFVFAAVFGFLFALGDNFVLFKIFYNLPFFGLLRIPARIMFFVVIAFSVLSVFGFDYLLKSKVEKTTLIKLLIAIAIPLILVLMAVSGSLSRMLGSPDELVDLITGLSVTPFVVTLLVSLIIFLLYQKKISGLVLGIALIVVSFSDLYLQGSDFNQGKKDPKQSYNLSSELKNIFVPKDNNKLFRVSTRHYSPSYMATMRNQGMMDEIMLVEGYNQLVFNHIPPPCDVQTIHDLYNVKYELEFNQQQRGFNFVERQSLYPRAWFVYDAKISNPENIKSFMENNKETIDYSKTVILESPTEKPYSSNEIIPLNKIIFSEYKNNSISCEVETDEDGLLVFSEIWYPDWKISIDGKEAQMLKANYSFRAAEISKGKHSVQMKYESDSFDYGLFIALGTILLSIIGIVFLKKE